MAGWRWDVGQAPKSWMTGAAGVYPATSEEKVQVSGAEGQAGWDPRRKRARFRSWHRGTREMDLILGPFADARLPALTVSEMEQYERLLDIPDTDLLGWITGAKPVPSDAEPLFLEVRAFAAQAKP